MGGGEGVLSLGQRKKGKMSPGCGQPTKEGTVRGRRSSVRV